MRGIVGVAVVLATAMAGGEAAAGSASGRTPCHYVASGPPGPRGNYVEIEQRGEVVLINRSARKIVFSSFDWHGPGRGVTVTPLECLGRDPTVDNIDRILLISDRARGVRLDLRPGALGPGASESGRGGEIELILRAADNIPPQPVTLNIRVGEAPNKMTMGRAAGTEQINLNPRRERVDDMDLYVEDVAYKYSQIRVELGGGNDVFDGRGPGSLEPSGLRASLSTLDGADRIFAPSSETRWSNALGAGGWSIGDGGGGPDQLVAGGNGDLLYGRAGRDSLIGGPGPDFLVAGPGDDRVRTGGDGEVDEIDCGPGNDRGSAGKEDVLRDCENVIRS